MGFSIVSIGLLRLQVTHHIEYRDLAKENHVRLEVLRAPRGSIYDRNGVLLADSAPRFSIVFRPFPAESAAMTRVTQSAQWIRDVAELVQVDTAEVRAGVTLGNRSGQTVVLLRTAPFEVRAAVEEMRTELPGVEVQIEPLRRYPYGTARVAPARLRRADQRARARRAPGAGLSARGPDRAHRRRARTRTCCAAATAPSSSWSTPWAPGVDLERGAATPAVAWPRPGADARPGSPAGARGGHVGSHARRRGRDRPARRRHSRSGQPAGVRSQRVLARNHERALAPAQPRRQSRC